MGNARKTVPSSGFISTGVDFLAIYQSVFSTLQSIRSNDGIRPGRLVLRSDETGISENGESLLNAFYRSLGLPAIRDDAKIDAQRATEGGDDSDLTQNGTINYFGIQRIGLPNGPAEVANREYSLSALNSTKNGAVTEQSVINGIKFMMLPAPIDGGLTNEYRPAILPLATAGDVTVFPVSRRVCPLFYAGDFQEGTQPAPRAFLESVIYNSLFKTDDTPAAKTLRDSIASITGDTDLANELSSKNILVLRFIQKAYTAMYAASTQYFQTLTTRDQLFRSTSYFPALKKSGPGIKQGYYDIQYSDAQLLFADNAAGKFLLSLITEPELDRAIRLQTAEVTELDNFYNMLPYNIANSESQIMRAASGLSDDAPAVNLFADIVVDIATLDRDKKRQSLRETEERQRVLRNNFEMVRSGLEIFTGTTTGISIFDILAIFISLYLLEPNHLIGLLNDAAIERLRAKQTSAAFSGIGLNEIIESRSSPTDALLRLEQLVTEQLNLAQTFFKQASGNTK